jgi:hypothetical protein
MNMEDPSLALQNADSTRRVNDLSGRRYFPYVVHTNGYLVWERQDGSQLSVSLRYTLLLCAEEIILHSNTQSPGERKD